MTRRARRGGVYDPRVRAGMVAWRERMVAAFPSPEGRRRLDAIRAGGPFALGADAMFSALHEIDPDGDAWKPFTFAHREENAGRVWLVDEHDTVTETTTEENLNV